MFALKKFVASLLMPLPLGLAVLCGGVILLVAGRARLGRKFALAAAVILAAFSNRFLSVVLLRPLETRFPPIPEFAAGHVPDRLAGCQLVVVLGGGNAESPGLSASNLLSTSALERTAEAVRLLRGLPGARLVVSGPGAPGHATHASILAAAAESLGVDSSRIDMISSAKDTEDESHAVTALAAGRRLALVTSAWHMPRASHLFRKAGASFVECPTDFVAKDSLGASQALEWTSDSLSRSTLAVHEWLGLLWLELRGA